MLIKAGENEEAGEGQAEATHQDTGRSESESEVAASTSQNKRDSSVEKQEQNTSVKDNEGTHIIFLRIFISNSKLYNIKTTSMHVLIFILLSISGREEQPNNFRRS